MVNLLTERNLLNGLTIAIKVNIMCFIAAVIISVGWTYLLAGFWDLDYLMYLCVFYGINLTFTLGIKKWYVNYLKNKETSQIAK